MQNECTEYTEHKDENLMSDYQFKYIMDLKDENTALKSEIEALRAGHIVSGENGMTDFQFRAFLELIYEGLKVRFEAGKAQEEILAVVGDLIKGMGSGDVE